jgi:hypothetical protein
MVKLARRFRGRVLENAERTGHAQMHQEHVAGGVAQGRQGLAAGRADISLAVAAESARRQAAAEAALAQTNAQIADLERARESL